MGKDKDKEAENQAATTATASMVKVHLTGTSEFKTFAKRDDETSAYR